MTSTAIVGQIPVSVRYGTGLRLVFYFADFVKGVDIKSKEDMKISYVYDVRT